MTPLHGFDLLEAIAKGVSKPVLKVGFDPDIPWTELVKAAPYLFDADGCPVSAQIVTSGGGYIVCDDEAELMRLYHLTVGDDGPTETNPYDGPVRVYAITSAGQENT